MKICAISDLHGYLPKDLPESDLLLIGGDIMPLNIQSDMKKSEEWLKNEFKQWCKDQETYEIVVIAGNHDWIFERNPDKVKKIFRDYGLWFHYLNNETIKLCIEGIELTIFGTPYCHRFGNWAFMREDDTLREKFQACPDNVDIILSHDAPYGITDICLERLAYTSEGHIGNIPLRERLNMVNYKYLLHGHLHSSDHTLTEFKGGLVANVSLLGEKYTLNYPPLLFDY
jgi:Icc-related predicted phosphoesterase